MTVILYLPLKCNVCEVVGWFFSSWDGLLKNVREANVKFFKSFERGGLGKIQKDRTQSYANF